MSKSFIHTPSDGRGKRKVFINDIEISRVIYANEKKGLVRFCPSPIKADRHGDVYSRTLKGTVRIEFIGDAG
ncbi:hypothetical protein CH54_3823 [Yersinia rochesterensis]|uniref:Uncharacterized protein n=1 Tax=Yersinia rochesterensis TaxID=1604335 RepID=A0ABM5SJW4_9GAMM|nr:hypothetical protein [Yersinia rochesterensis]AJI88540.1 hypothetical protein AW19_1962 [Yersinia frederiksenii Y225]AJJ34716.1 hypothetical protein CH54_3823 [Yersinia rochesterensis]